MKVLTNLDGGIIPTELKRLVSAIQKNHGDCEHWMEGYNKNPYGFTWYGHRMTVEPLFTVYGAIGYSIDYRGYQVHVDNEMRKIIIYEV